MSFSVDQFMQVKCMFQLTTESESSESIHTNNEQIRLCASVNLDNNSSALIVMVCSNQTGNNHILAYYIERRNSRNQQQVLPTKKSTSDTSNLISFNSIVENEPINEDDRSINRNSAVTFANLAAQSTTRDPQLKNDTTVVHSNKTKRVKTKPRIIVKQIYYHNYNEDIVAICLSKQGTKLVLVNASSTVYVIPIKNILLNLHAQQLRSSQGRSMYFYDASILYCAQSFPDPTDVVYWESPETQKSTVILANHDGKLLFIDVEEKKITCSSSVSEPIKSIKIIRDKFSYSLLITCKSLNQYRLILELLEKNNLPGGKNLQVESHTVISLPKLSRRKYTTNQKQLTITTIEEQNRQSVSWSAKPLLIRPLSTSGGGISGAATAANALQRVLLPSANRFGSQASLMSSFSDVRERSLTLVNHQEPNLISLVDVLGSNSQTSQSVLGTNNQTLTSEPRLLRFFSDKQYFYQPQRPNIICKLDSLDPDELITELILTDRFIALTTDRDRCIVNSRNCCKLKSSLGVQLDLSPLVKEITFNHEEKIMSLLKSPALNDQDNIIDSFLLVTSRSIYSIEARHSCRELFINLIDSHLAIKRTLFMSKPRQSEQQQQQQQQQPFSLGRMISSASENHLLAFDFIDGKRNIGAADRSAKSNLLINSFLQHRDAYERVCHDSQAFSTLFKLDLSSLYEAYADRLLQRGQFELANRFFLMASFDHIKILGKYIRIGAYRETIEYVKDLLDDENDFRKVLGESERIELSKIAFECLLAKAIVERTKTCLYKMKSIRSVRSKLLHSFPSILNEKQQLLTKASQKRRHPQPPDIQQLAWAVSPALRGLDPFSLCEHSPRCQDAKLSATTIVPSAADDEETLTSSNTGTGCGESNNFQRLCTDTTKLTRVAKINEQRMATTRLECEKSVLDFMRNIMPSSMFEYTIDQLLDFNLIEFVEFIARTDIQILSFIKMVTRYRDEERLVFRASGFKGTFLNQLTRLNQADLVKVCVEKEEYLEFLTSIRVTKALVKDIGLTCEYYGYQHTLVQFRKYSFAALHHLETYRQLINCQNERYERKELQQEKCESDNVKASSKENVNTEFYADDDNANDGLIFSKNAETTYEMEQNRQSNCVTANRTKTSFNSQQKQHVESIFIEFLTACLDESTEDSCRLWYSYVNFYLNYVAELHELQSDILRLLEQLGDCRLAISLYRAIHRDQSMLKSSTLPTDANSKSGKRNITKGSVSDFKTSKYKSDTKIVVEKMSFLKENLIDNTPLETMEQLYSLANLFKNEFLMRLLEKTLDLIPQSGAAGLNAMSLVAANMC